MEKEYSTHERIKQKLPEVIGDEAFTQILKATLKSNHRMAFKLAYLCGLRVSEICNIKKEDFDHERRLIFVRQGKGKKDRYVPYPTKFIKKIEIEKNIPISCGVRALEIAFKNKCKKILNRNDLHFHNLRHSFATSLLGKGIPITDVQFWLGHSKLTTTSIYLKVSPDMALKRYEDLWE